MEIFRTLIILATISSCVSHTTEVCGTTFTDHYTSSLKAGLVIEAELIDSTKVFVQDHIYYAQFEITSVLKSIPDFETPSSISIGLFTETEDQSNKCVFENLQPHIKYIFFLKFSPNDVFEMTAFPIQSNDKVAKEIKDFIIAPDDMLAAPKVTAKEIIKNGEYRSNITVECTSTGFPAPLFKWWYKGTRVHNKKYLKITRSSHSTSLTLLNATHNFHGFYTCEAINVAGSSNASIQINVQLHNSTIQADHTVICPAHLDNGFCFHNATCLIFVFSGAKNCKCKLGYVGMRCETYFDYDETKSKTFIGSLFGKDVKVPLMILIPVILLMLLVALVIVLAVMIKNSYNQRKYLKASQEQNFA